MVPVFSSDGGQASRAGCGSGFRAVLFWLQDGRKLDPGGYRLGSQAGLQREGAGDFARDGGGEDPQDFDRPLVGNGSSRRSSVPRCCGSAPASHLGSAFVVEPQWLIYRPAHAHMNVVGFLTMLVFGVGYQLLPRLFGQPLYSNRLAAAHLVLANLGLAGLVLGFLISPHHGVTGRWISGGGG